MLSIKKFPDRYERQYGYDEQNENKLISTICILMSWKICKKTSYNYERYLKNAELFNTNVKL